MSERGDAVRALRAARPRSRFVRVSAAVVAVLVAAAWWRGRFDVADLLSERRLANVERFLREIRPYPLHGREWDWGVAWSWAVGIFRDGVHGAEFDIPSGAEALGLTLAMSVAAIVLAGALGALGAFPAARTFATPEPYLPGAARRTDGARRLWRTVLVGSRGVLVLVRAIPEYVWCFLLIGMLGISAWPAVLALALHNAGILGKLDAETIENLSPHALRALRGSGATRRQIAVHAAVPAALSRFLLYFFYRWETCVRESTVLGMLGIASLGAAIGETHIRDRYDEMVLYVLLGALLVLAGDLISAVARGLVRRAS